MYRKICSTLKHDRIERVRKADEAMRTKLINGEVKEAWRIIEQEEVKEEGCDNAGDTWLLVVCLMHHI